MSTWLARILFPDGRTFFADYSAFDQCVGPQLFTDYRKFGDLNEAGDVVSKESVKGDPIKQDSQAPWSIDDLIPVLVVAEPAKQRWHAIYCPNRRMLVAAESWGASPWQHQQFELWVGNDGLLHLSEGTRDGNSTPIALCGATTTEELPFADQSYPGNPDPGLSQQDLQRDLYAEWSDGRVCRRCLLDKRNRYWNTSSD